MRIDREEKAARAEALFREGYNCAQSVVLAYAEEMGLEMKAAARLSSGFGGGVGGGVKVTPICFLIVKDGNVRMMPVAEPASSTADRIVEMVPDTLDKLTAYLDSKEKD